ncbi:MAG: HD domain-containing protein [Clostridia bacterium]|nr:HD domain-containing protein [Clostridia bacterium]
MKPQELIAFFGIIEKLKCNTRHSWTSDGRRESVAEHSWRLAVMALLCEDEFDGLDMNKVVKMCLIHDLGEAVTGDVPAFDKTSSDEAQEERAIAWLLSQLPSPYAEEWTILFAEMKEKKSEEARLYKALDNLETLIQHNEADLSTWLKKEHTLNLTYGDENCAWHPYLQALKAQVKQDSIQKINEGKQAL